MTSQNIQNRFLLWQTRRAIEQQQKMVDRFFERASFANPIQGKVIIRELIEIERRLVAMRERTGLLAERISRLFALERTIFMKVLTVIFMR